MQNPEISIIIPVHNAESTLNETIASIQNQRYNNFELIFIDIGSTDGSYNILKEAATHDSRFSVFQSVHTDTGSSRNYGFSIARGKYVIFLTPQTYLYPDMLLNLYYAAEHTNADISVCSFIEQTSSGSQRKKTGVFTGLLPPGITEFNYQHCPDFILRITNPEVFNKLYRSDFISHHDLHFDEISSYNILTFATVCMAVATKVTYIAEPLMINHITEPSTQINLNNVQYAIESTLRQLEQLPHANLLKNAIYRFVVENYLSALADIVENFDNPETSLFYERVHNTFNSFNFKDMEAYVLHNNDLYREFCTIQKHDYNTMKKLRSKRLIVSLTSYPKRITNVSQVLKSIFTQTRKPDKVVLWLAENQFPHKEADLPADLLHLINKDLLTVRWCDDLKPHKKYFYAFQEYKNDLVVTIDDDIEYSSNMLSSLYSSYLLYPNAVSTVRAHLIITDENKNILPYHCWIPEIDACIHTPSMQLMATGGAGVLYPPNLFREEFFDPDTIKSTCLLADDLWLKAMQLVSDVPVVLARTFEPLVYIPDSQQDALHLVNVKQHQNDVQLRNICQWVDSKFEPGILTKKLTESNIGVSLVGIEEVSKLMHKERNISRNSALRLQNQLHSTLNQLRQTEKQLMQSESKLKRTEKNLLYAIETKPISRQLTDLGDDLAKQKQDLGKSPGLMLKYLVYYTAWVPEKWLAAHMYCLQNGLKRTVKKLLKRG